MKTPEDVLARLEASCGKNATVEERLRTLAQWHADVVAHADDRWNLLVDLAARLAPYHDKAPQ